MRLIVAGVLPLAGAAAIALASCADESTFGETIDASVVDASDEEAVATSDSGPRDASISVFDAAVDATAPLVDSCDGVGAAAGVWVADGHLCMSEFAAGMPPPRQMAFAPNGDLFVLAGGFILAFSDTNKDHVISADETFSYSTLSLGLTHGLAFSPDGAFLYASSESNIIRWAYLSGDHVPPGPEQVVIRDMPTGGNHYSRTLAFDGQGRLYVNVGSEGDVDIDPQLAPVRAQVRRFALPAVVPDGGLTYDSGEVFASGLRNEVGLAFDSKSRMWGAENGSDGMYQYAPTDDNPAEEINRLDGPGARFYGYPYCWTEFGFDGGLGKGTQWAYVKPDPRTDVWCRDATHVHTPSAAMQGHWAPLGIVEYTGASLPWKGDLFVASHGSADRVPPVGRLIARAHVVGDDIVSVTPIVGNLVDGGLEQGTWDARPVDIRVGPDGALYFSDDRGNRIFRLGYKP